MRNNWRTFTSSTGSELLTRGHTAAPTPSLAAIITSTRQAMRQKIEKKTQLRKFSIKKSVGKKIDPKKFVEEKAQLKKYFS